MISHISGIRLAIRALSASITLVSAAAAQHGDLWEDSLAMLLRSSREMKLPYGPLENKIREGRAKCRPTSEIYSAVKIRRNFLDQLRDRHHGTLPQGYMQRLFDLERSIQYATPLSEAQRTGRIATDPLPGRNTHRIAPEVERTGSADTLSASKGSHPKEAVKVRKDTRRMLKAGEKANRMTEKATARAERRMENIQKRLQKKAMKRHGQR